MEYEFELEDLNKELRREVILSKASKLETMVNEFVNSEKDDEKRFTEIKKLQREMSTLVKAYLSAYSVRKEFPKVNISEEDHEFCSNVNEKCVDLMKKVLKRIITDSASEY